MKICILSSFEDSMQKDTGASVRIYNLAKGLAATGNDVKVIMPQHHKTRELVDGISVLGLKGMYPKALLDVLIRFVNVGRPTALYFYDLLFIHRASRFLRDADVVQFEQQSSGGLLIPFVKRVLKKPIVVDCHDVFQALRVEHTNIMRKILETFLEKQAYRNADLALTVSEMEKKCLISMVIKIFHIEVIPNGVDTTAFSKSNNPDEVRKKYGLEDFRVVVFVGNLSYPPNQEAIQLLSSVIAPKVHKKIEAVKFLIVGKIRDKIESSELIFTGFVENLSEVLSASDVAVAPLLQGSGTRLKILEYFSCNLPVVSTSIGAEGLDVEDGANIFVEDNLAEFSNRVIDLLQNKELSTTVGNNARALAISTYDWKNITKKLESNLYTLLLE